MSELALVLIWFGALKRVLFCVPTSVRLEVLRKLTDSEIERQKEPPVTVINASEFVYPREFEYRRPQHEAVSLIIMLVRSITSSHSPDEAAKVLFREHRRGTGSGWLPDYLDRLTGTVRGWWYPGATECFVFVRHGTVVRWLPEQLTDAEWEFEQSVMT
jgi:hypothetical protein